MSLNDHGVAIIQRYGVEIKKQSIDERFNESSVNLLRELLRRQLDSELTSVIRKKGLVSVLNRFSAVKIKDSTRFQAPDNLKAMLPGSGGGASEAGVHLQFEYDLLSGKTTALGFTDGKYQDNTDAIDTLDSIKGGELIVRDLGFFSFRALEYIHDAEAFFITRRPSTMVLFHEKNQKKVNYNALYSQLKNCKKDVIEVPVVTSQGMPVRLIVERLPKQRLAERLAKAEQNARKKGRKLSKEYKSRARLNMFLTNVPLSWVEAKKIRKIYRLRWQIELYFKAWKSFYHLNENKPMKLHRFECYLYGSLLLIMLNWELVNNFSAILYRCYGQPLSTLKFFKAASQTITWLSLAIREGGNRLIVYLERLYLASRNLLVEERKVKKVDIH